MTTQNTTPANYDRKNIMRMAWDIFKKNVLSFGEAIKKAWEFFRKQALAQKALTLQYFKITFIKACGEIAERIASNGKLKDDNTTLLFFSITDNGHRKAIIENILSICPVNVDFKIS